MGIFDKIRGWADRKQRKREEPKKVDELPEEPAPSDKITKEEWDYAFSQAYPDAKSEYRARKRLGLKSISRDFKLNWIKERAKQMAIDILAYGPGRARVREALAEIEAKRAVRAERRRKVEEGQVVVGAGAKVEQKAVSI